MKLKKTIIIDDAVPFAHEMFSHLGEVITLSGREISNADLKPAHALIVRSRTQVNQELLKDTAVTFVGSTVVGLDHIDQTWLKSNFINFYSAQGCNANSVAEFIITCLLQLAEQHRFKLAEKTLGIIGVGHVGKLVHHKAKTLGIQTLLNDPPRQKKELSEDFVDLKTALTANMVTFHTPLTLTGSNKSHHLLNKQTFQYLQSNSILLNAARGGIIDEAIWAQTPTLANVIDCWENEPNICHNLYQTADYATPHIAGHSFDAKISGSEKVYHALCNAWNQKPQYQWKMQLPKFPCPIKINNRNQSDQSIICQVLTATHNPQQDDLTIRANAIETVQQNFETYRRQYPIYREWHQHTLLNVPQHLKTTFTQLGFKT